MATRIETEKQRRLAMWSHLLAEGGPNRVQPSLLRKLRIYGGAQGIWVDQEVTSSVAENGVTVGLLHTGGQHRFKFQVLRRYGATCAMCDLQVRELLEAAHIVPDEKNGSNDPRNGLVLCRNHHVALDRGLLAIHPESLEFHIRRDGPDKGMLGVTRNDLTHLERRPHLDALRWRWERWSELEN